MIGKAGSRINRVGEWAPPKFLTGIGGWVWQKFVTSIADEPQSFSFS